MAPAAPILETRALTKRFGGVVAVDGVDFRVEPHELRCIIGPNGAGKSSFFKCLTGLSRTTSGSIVFDGHDITWAEPHAIARLGIATKTQVPSVFEGLTVRENLWVAAARVAHGASQTDAVTEEALHRSQLQAMADAIVGQLAHGVRQWVELAMVLASAPKLILLDEPTAGMTSAEIARVEGLLRGLCTSAAVIVVEHDVKFIRRIAKTVTVLHNGRILVEDDVESVLRDGRVRDVYLGRQALA
jgi:branched-chain amino acid transport system ATP-binding protein